MQLEIVEPLEPEELSGKALLPEDSREEEGRERSSDPARDRQSGDTRPDAMRVLILRKSLGAVPWNYQPGSQERLLNSMTEEVCASYEMINALIGLGELVASTGDMDSFLHRALERLSELTRAETVYVRTSSSNSLLLAGQIGSLELNLQPSIELSSPGIETSVFVTGEEATVIEHAMLDTSDPLCGQLQAAFVAPIFFKNERRGVLVLGAEQCRGRFLHGRTIAACARGRGISRRRLEDERTAATPRYGAARHAGTRDRCGDPDVAHAAEFPAQ